MNEVDVDEVIKTIKDIIYIEDLKRQSVPRIAGKGRLDSLKILQKVESQLIKRFESFNKLKESKRLKIHIL